VSRQVVQLHTIEQWFSVDPQVQQIILRALRVRDRRWAWRLNHEHSKLTTEPAPGWEPCKRCDQRGWILNEPRKAGIHPSAMYSPCLLKIYNEAIGAPRELMHEASLLLLFDLGTAVHRMLQTFGAAGAWGDYYRAEVPIEETPIAQQLMIVGHADADNIIVVDEIPGAPIFEVGVVHEYKTINDAGYKKLSGRPLPQHKQQATIYSACLNRPVVVYLYMNKDNSNTQDFPIVFEPQLWDTMSKKAAAIRDAVLSKTPPSADVGYHCKNCGFHHQCEPYKAAIAAAKKG
jgi:CRISPR/Cas system-associated exonuclease Cas4 (RecB family)